MVGFGSSLRMARRTGWEGAYLDYETLKLLLSQIEAVYEEQGHWQHLSQDDEYTGGGSDDDDDDSASSDHNGIRYGGTTTTSSSARQKRRHERRRQTNKRAEKKRRHKKILRRDYRDELFLESDSDIAFASNASDVLGPSFYSSGDEDMRMVLAAGGAVNPQPPPHHHHLHPPPTSSISPMAVYYDPNHQPLHQNSSVVQPQQHPPSLPQLAHDHGPSGIRTKPFTLSYSKEDSASTDDESGGDLSHTCGVVPMSLKWVQRSVEKSDKEKIMKIKKERMLGSTRRGICESAYFVGRGSGRGAAGALETFLIGDENDDDDHHHNDFYEHSQYNNDGHVNHGHVGNEATMTTVDEGFRQASMAPPSSLFIAPVHRSGSFTTLTTPANHLHDNNNSEQSSLLGRRQASTPPQTFYYGMNHAVTPPRENSYHHYNHSTMTATGSTGITLTTSTSLLPPSGVVASRHQTMAPSCIKQRPPLNKWDMERKRQRRQRRIRRKKELERKVPRHIRVAHSKARAITERFLGLLRAEVEKCTLFAQARLGELADTAGSLRFPFFDEVNNSHHTDSNYFGATTYEHPLSDGGMHPSASSSDDEGGRGGQGLFPWSDSSADDDSSNANRSTSIRTSASGGGGIPTTADAAAGPGHPNAIRDPKMFKPILAYGKQESLDAAQRQIAHFDELRSNLPIFQRNDRIVGEDLLLISAVDEADGYTAVGVELLHVLRYICLNMVAVRKICRKHDRLLMNRMLGGYYRRRYGATAGSGGCGVSLLRSRGKEMPTQEVKTLGGMLAPPTSGENHEKTGSLLMLSRHDNYKLEGVYDVKIQRLSCSCTVEGIAACLAWALSEYEISRSRADAIANLKDGATPKRAGSNAFVGPQAQASAFSSSFLSTQSSRRNLESEVPPPIGHNHETGESSQDGVPSSASSCSLTRLRFTIVSIFALLEAVRVKINPLNVYLARSLLAFSGRSFIGEGLEGCSRETLNFLVAYNPDATILLDSFALHNGLKRGNWRKCPKEHVMISSLAAAATSPSSLFVYGHTSNTEQMVMKALSILPKTTNRHDLSARVARCFSATDNGPSRHFDKFDGYFPRSLLHLQRISALLSSMNHFVAYPTSNFVVKAVGAKPAHSVFIIGATNLGAMVVAAFHCYCMSRYPSFGNQLQLTLPFFQRSLIFSSCAAVVGNILCALASRHGSVPGTVLGRFVLGMGSAELVHRQLILKCLPAILVVSESASYCRYQSMGRILGIFLGAFVAMGLPYLDNLQFQKFHSLQGGSWWMVFLWFVQLVHVLYEWQFNAKANFASTMAPHELEHQFSKDVQSSSESSGEDEDTAAVVAVSPNGILRSRDGVDVSKSFLEAGRDIESTRKSGSGTDLSALRIRIVTDTALHLRKRRHPLKVFLVRVGKVITYKVAISVSMVLLMSMWWAQEVLFTSCSIVTDQYFQWSGAVAGSFMGGIMLLCSPIDYVCERISRRYEERTVIKRAISVSGFGLIFMINWSAIAAFITSVGRSQANSRFWSQGTVANFHYDWWFGIFQYIIGFLVAWIGLISLEGATLSLLSKISLAGSRNPLLNIATLVTFCGFLARFFGDMHVLVVGLSSTTTTTDIIINNNLINALVVPMLGICLIVGVLVRKHFFFLM